MINERRVLVIVPAWNEEGVIRHVVDEVLGELPGADLLVIDDGSTDDTANVAVAAGAYVACLPFNLGVGGARRVGYRYARDHGYDVVVQIDADGQHDPRYVPKLIDCLDTADLVIGARFAGEGDYRVRGPRRLAMRLLALVLSRITRATLADTTSGFRVCNRSLICLYARWYPAEYLGDTIETLVRAARTGHRVTQIPVAMRRRIAGTPSHPPLRAMVYLLRAMLVLLLSLIRT
jgi:glycosyltransferase involved in cell wall biosynthesis